MEKDFMIRPIVFFYASLLFLLLASLEAIAQSPTPGCIRATPALTLSPEKQTALSGEMKYYNLNIRNQDSAECPARQIYIVLHAGAPISAESSHPMVSMSPGQSGDVNLWVWSDEGITNSSHAFLAEALDLQLQEPMNTVQGELEITGNPGCVRSPPAIGINPGNHRGLAGAEWSYQVTVSNNDSSVCAATTFDLSTVLPQGLLADLANETLTLSPEQSLTFELKVSSDPNLPAGEYHFDFVASDASIVDHRAHSTVTLLIEEPAPPPPVTPPPPVVTPPPPPPVVAPPPPVVAPPPPVVAPPPPVVAPPPPPPVVTPPPPVVPPTGSNPIRVRTNKKWMKIKWNRFKPERRTDCRTKDDDDGDGRHSCSRPRVRYQVSINGQLKTQTWGRSTKIPLASGTYEIEVWVVTTDRQRFLWGTRTHTVK